MLEEPDSGVAIHARTCKPLCLPFQFNSNNKDKTPMMRDRIAFRTTPADNEALVTIADALPRTAFPSLTATMQATLMAAAHLAREGLLPEVLAAAKAAR